MTKSKKSSRNSDLIVHPSALPSSVLANQSQNVPAPECCCFSARFVNLVLYLFNFIFFLSGCCIILLTVLYGRPEVSRYLGETTKFLNNIISLLNNGHLVQVIHYSMLFCGIIIIVISLLNICFSTATSWSKSSDYYYYHRRHHPQQQHQHENETLLLYNNEQDLQRNLMIDDDIESRQHRTSGYFNDSMISSHQSRASDLTLKNSLTTNSSSSSNSSWPTSKQHKQNKPHHRNGTKELELNQREQLRKQRLTSKHHSSWSHFANSTVVLCCYIFILLFLFTVQLVVGLLSLITVSPEQVFVRTRLPQNDDFLISVRESVDVRELLVNRADEIEPLYPVFQCCGWIYYDDYEFLPDPDHRNKSISVPDTCCKTLIKGCGRRKHPNNIYYDGCWSKFGAEMRDYVLMLGWTALGFAVIELIGLMFAVCHYVQIISKS